jgi:Type III secretion system lipoprotein chaperone (YscW)
MRPTSVRVHVQLPPATVLPAGARVRVQVEDVARADAAAPVVAAEAFALPAEPASVLGPFALAAVLSPGGDYAVRVHVDRTGDGRVVAGDLVSVAKHAVPGGRAELEVPVRLVPEEAEGP